MADFKGDYCTPEKVAQYFGITIEELKSKYPKLYKVLTK